MLFETEVTVRGVDVTEGTHEDRELRGVRRRFNNCDRFTVESGLRDA